MAIALVRQSVNSSINTSGSPPTAAITITSSDAGSLLVLCFQGKTNILLTSVSDNQSNTWTKAVGLVAGSAAADLWYATNVAAGTTTVSAVESGITQYAANVSEWSGVATGAPTATNSANVSTSPNRTGTVTPATAGDLAIAMIARNSSTAATLTTTGGWAALTDGTLPAGVTDHQAYNITPDTTAVEGQWTTASGTATAGLIALFAQATVASGAPALPVVAPSLAAMQRSNW